MKNNSNFKNAGSSRAKMWRNILLVLGAIALIASYIADIRVPHPGMEIQEVRQPVERTSKDGFQKRNVIVTQVIDGDTVLSRTMKEKRLPFIFSESTRRNANKPMVHKVQNT